MTWLTPLSGLILAAAVIPPLIVLYFLKLRRKPQAIASTLLWKRSVEDLRANAPFQRLRKSLLLFLQLLALILLAISIMQPQIQAGRLNGGKTVIMIDNSASMTSTDLGDGSSSKSKTRLDEAKRRAKERIEALYSGGLFSGTSGETMVIVFSDRAEVLSRFTSSKQQLLTAVERIEPTHGQTNIAEALKLARAYTTNVNPDQKDRPIADPSTIELYSDGRIADLGEQVLRGETMNYHAIGSDEADNVAIAGISVERPYDRPDAVEVFASLVNFNKQPVTCDVQLSVDAHARGIESTTLPPAAVNPSTNLLEPGRANVVFSAFEQPRGAVIEVANLREDKLAADNVERVVVPPPTRLVAALVAEDQGRSIVRRALEGIKFERLDVMAAAEYEARAAKGEMEGYDVIVLDNYKPTAMPPGRYLTFGPTPPVEGLNDYGEGRQQLILSGKDEHPSMRFVNYDNLYIGKFRLVQPAADVQVLLEGSRGPAVLAVARGPMQLIHCTFDPLDSNWPFQRSFLYFIVNAVDYLGHSGEALTAEGLAPGDAITTRLPKAATDIKLASPERDDPMTMSPSDPTQFAWGPVRLSGLYTLLWKAPGSDSGESRPFAVNLLGEREGNLAVNRQLLFGQDKVSGRESDRNAYTPLWPYALLVCLAVLMFEWWVYHRKAYI